LTIKPAWITLPLNGERRARHTKRTRRPFAMYKQMKQYIITAALPELNLLERFLTAWHAAIAAHQQRRYERAKQEIRSQESDTRFKD